MPENMKNDPPEQPEKKENTKDERPEGKKSEEEQLREHLGLNEEEFNQGKSVLDSLMGAFHESDTKSEFIQGLLDCFEKAGKDAEREKGMHIFLNSLERPPVNISKTSPELSEGDTEIITLIFKDKQIPLNCREEHENEKGEKTTREAQAIILQISAIIRKEGNPEKIRVLARSWNLPRRGERYDETLDTTFDYTDVEEYVKSVIIALN